METLEYIIAWLVYLAAAMALAVIGWRILKKYLWRDLAYLLQGFLVAILFTPWYVMPEEELMAPAFIIFLMDTITMDVVAGIRSLIPLVMTMLLSILVTIVLSVVRRLSR